MRKTFKYLKKFLPKNAVEVVHIRQHAYCVAKPENYAAAFVCPPSINPYTKSVYNSSILIQNESVVGIELGNWVTLVFYTDKAYTGEWVAIPYHP